MEDQTAVKIDLVFYSYWASTGWLSAAWQAVLQRTLQESEHGVRV